MTREERLQHIKEGKTILRARRQPKSDKWEIVTYTGSTFMVYSFDKFETRKECEDYITTIFCNRPDLFISDFSIDESKPDAYQKLKQQHNNLLKQTEKLVDRLEWVDGFIHNAAANKHNQEYIDEARELIKILTGMQALKP